jgi:hypothetical protein
MLAEPTPFYGTKPNGDESAMNFGEVDKDLDGKSSSKRSELFENAVRASIKNDPF